MPVLFHPVFIDVFKLGAWTGTRDLTKNDENRQIADTPSLRASPSLRIFSTSVVRPIFKRFAA